MRPLRARLVLEGVVALSTVAGSLAGRRQRHFTAAGAPCGHDANADTSRVDLVNDRALEPNRGGIRVDAGGGRHHCVGSQAHPYTSAARIVAGRLNYETAEDEGAQSSLF